MKLGMCTGIAQLAMQADCIGQEQVSGARLDECRRELRCEMPEQRRQVGMIEGAWPA